MEKMDPNGDTKWNYNWLNYKIVMYNIAFIIIQMVVDYFVSMVLCSVF